jgi:hypothetical protein
MAIDTDIDMAEYAATVAVTKNQTSYAAAE